MRRIWLIAPLIVGLLAFVALAESEESGHDHSMHSMYHSANKEASDKARCAYDGMMMKAEAMKEMKHGDETLYFCNEEQMMAFQALGMTEDEAAS